MKISVPNVIEFYWTAKPNTIETFYKRFEFVFQVKLLSLAIMLASTTFGTKQKKQHLQ
jgi:hypothetical protein